MNCLLLIPRHVLRLHPHQLYIEVEDLQDGIINNSYYDKTRKFYILKFSSRRAQLKPHPFWILSSTRHDMELAH